MDVVFDVDGTLMNIEHRVKYAKRNLPKLDALDYPIPNPDYDYGKFESEIVNDTPNHEVFAIAIALHLEEHRIIIASGRKRKQMNKTLEMLLAYGKEHMLSEGGKFWSDDSKLCLRERVYFRADGDNRRDDVVKEEMYEQMLKDGYDPKLVFDDRQQVVDMWRSKGIRVCQVAVGDF